jgi:3-oxoadipate enol-lactonase
VIVGEHDVSTPPEMADSLAKSIPAARQKLVRNAGHVPAIEQPETLGRLVSEFLHEVAYV